MPRTAEFFRDIGRWIRRRVPPTIGWLLLAALVTYLVGGWLRADEQPDRTVMTFRDGWVILRPTWLYAAVMITILVTLLVALGIDIARRQASRASWREQVRAQVNTLRRELLLASSQPPRG